MPGGGITAAAGQIQYESAIQSPITSKRIIAQTWCSSVANDITNKEWASELMTCGSQIKFEVESGIEIRDYQENQAMIPQHLEPTFRWMTVDKAKYFMVKVDKITEMQVCNWRQKASKFTDLASKRMKQILDPELLLKMAVYTDSKNKGNLAGQHGNVDLGTVGAPVHVTGTNIVEFLTRLRSVLKGACRWDDGNMFVVLPQDAEAAFFASPLGTAGIAACCNDNSPISNGKLNNRYMGFNVMFSNNVPYVVDPSGNTAFYVVAGNEMATGFVQQIEESEISNAITSFGKYYKGLWVYGHQPLMPDALALGYARF